MSRPTYIPAGESGKSEAWVVLEAGPKSRIYAGLKPGTTRDDLEQALANDKVGDLLSGFKPTVGDAVFVPAGTVHTLGDVVVFEVQENSDVTFRLYDWDHIDPQTGKPRPLQVEQAMACIDLEQVAVGPVTPVVETTTPALRERLFQCPQFTTWRVSGESPFTVGAVDTPRVLVSIAGNGDLEHDGMRYPVQSRRRRSLAGRGRRVFLSTWWSRRQPAGNRAAGIADPAHITAVSRTKNKGITR